MAERHRHRHRDHHRADRSNDTGDRDRDPSGVDAARQLLLREQRGVFKSGGAALDSARAAGIGFVYDEDEGGRLTEREKQQREERVRLFKWSRGRPLGIEVGPTLHIQCNLQSPHPAGGRHPRQARERNGARVSQVGAAGESGKDLHAGGQGALGFGFVTDGICVADTHRPLIEIETRHTTIGGQGDAVLALQAVRPPDGRPRVPALFDGEH